MLIYCLIEPPPKESEEAYKKNHYDVVDTLIYSVLEVKNKKDRDDIGDWHAHLPQLIADGKIRAHSVDLRQGGLESIHQGLEELKEGKVSGKKIVYEI